VTLRVVIWLSVPVLIVALAVLYAIIRSWTQDVPLCASWLRFALPLCR